MFKQCVEWADETPIEVLLKEAITSPEFGDSSTAKRLIATTKRTLISGEFSSKFHLKLIRILQKPSSLWVN
jgi:hypothetical protein